MQGSGIRSLYENKKVSHNTAMNSKESSNSAPSQISIMNEQMQGDEQELILDDNQVDQMEEIKEEVVHPVIQPHQSSDTLKNQDDRTNIAA